MTTVLSFALLTLYVVFVELAFQAQGTLSTYYGSVGVLAMIASFTVLLVAAGSLREEDSFKLFPRLGCFLSLLAVVCWIGTYAWGFYLG